MKNFAFQIVVFSVLFNVTCWASQGNDLGGNQLAPFHVVMQMEKEQDPIKKNVGADNEPTNENDDWVNIASKAFFRAEQQKDDKNREPFDDCNSNTERFFIEELVMDISRPNIAGNVQVEQHQQGASSGGRYGVSNLASEEE